VAPDVSQNEVAIFAAIIGFVAALIGALLGAWLAFFGQRRLTDRERRQDNIGAARAVFLEHVNNGLVLTARHDIRARGGQASSSTYLSRLLALTELMPEKDMKVVSRTFMYLPYFDRRSQGWVNLDAGEALSDKDEEDWEDWRSRFVQTYHALLIAGWPKEEDQAEWTEALRSGVEGGREPSTADEQAASGGR